MNAKILPFPSRESARLERGSPDVPPESSLPPFAERVRVGVSPPVDAARRADPNYVDAPYYALPFIRPHQRGGRWLPPPCADYQAACVRGREYAAHLALFLQANPLLAGGNVLGNVARSIDFGDALRHGYWVGFFSYLELLLLDGVAARPVLADWRAFESAQARPWV